MTDSREPDYIRTRTFAIDEQREIEGWLRDRIDEAEAQGLTWPRLTWKYRSDRIEALVEIWAKRPRGHVEPRWPEAKPG